GGHRVFLQRIRPHQAPHPVPLPIRWGEGGSAWTRLGQGCRVDALQRRLVLAPKVVATARYIEAIVVKDWHAINVTRAFAAVAEVLVNVSLRRGGIEVELPDFFQLPNTARSGRVGRRRCTPLTLPSPLSEGREWPKAG